MRSINVSKKEMAGKTSLVDIHIIFVYNHSTHL